MPYLSIREMHQHSLLYLLTAPPHLPAEPLHLLQLHGSVYRIRNLSKHSWPLRPASDVSLLLLFNETSFSAMFRFSNFKLMLRLWFTSGLTVLLSVLQWSPARSSFSNCISLIFVLSRIDSVSIHFLSSVALSSTCFFPVPNTLWTFLLFP